MSSHIPILQAKVHIWSKLAGLGGGALAFSHCCQLQTLALCISSGWSRF